MGIVDDLVINVSISDAGPINSIGQAGSCMGRESGSTVMGIVWLNRQLLRPGQRRTTGPNSMYQVALHEIGHVLGIGSPLWGEMLRDKTDGVPRDAHFPGPKAVEAFNEAGGGSYTGGKGAGRHRRVGGSHPKFHWSPRRAEYANSCFRRGGTVLSAITVQALADLGLVVDPSKADPYELPAFDRAAAADAADTETESLFANDVLEGPLVVVDENGKVVRIVRN